MSNRVDPSKVSIRAIQTRGAGAKKRHIVKWKVDGADKSRSFKTRAEAAARHAELTAATSGRGREMFDAATGEPASWGAHEDPTHGLTFLDLAVAVVAVHWEKDWGGKNRMSRVESLAQLTAYATRDGGPSKDLLRRVLRDWVLPHRETPDPLVPVKLRSGATATVVDIQGAIQWLLKNSLPLSEVSSVRAVEDILKKASKSTVTGKVLSPEMLGQLRASASLVYGRAVSAEYLSANPVKEAKNKVKGSTSEADPNLVPTPEEAQELVSSLQSISQQAVEQYTAFFTLMWSCGPRPSELYGLRMSREHVLPATGWGRITLREPLVGVGSRWTDDRTPTETRKGMKARKEGTSRVILVPPVAVRALREHIARTKPKNGDYIFKNSLGKPLNQDLAGDVWEKVRVRACDGQFDTLKLYELRHTAASMMLKAGVPVPRAAAQLGNSVTVFLRTYARVMSNDDQQFMDSMDAVLAK
jgi:integrase